MRLVSFLLVVCLTCSVFAETRFVVIHLKTGKQVQGEWIGEDSFTVQIKDRAGVLISIKRTSIENTEPLIPLPAEHARIPALCSPPQKSLAEIAAQLKQSRTGKTRVFTLTDLATAPEVSVIGGPEEPARKPAESSADSVDIQSWQKRIAALKKEIADLQRKETLASSRCEQARSLHFVKPKKRQGMLVLDPSAVQEECVRLAAIESERRDAESRLEDTQMQARRLGIPWSYLE